MQDAAARFEQLRGFIQHDRSNLQLTLDALDAGLQAGRAKDVVDLALSALEQLPGEPAIEYRLAYGLLQLNDCQQVVEICDRQLCAQDARSEWHYLKALAHLMVEDFELALAGFERFAQESTSLEPEITFYRARCLYSLGQIDDALQMFDRIPEPNNRQEEVLSVWALAALDANNAELAKDKIHQLEQQGTQSWVVAYVKGQLSLETLNGKQAEGELLEAARIDPKQGRVWSSLAYSYMLGMKVAEAQDAFEKAIRFMPNHIGTWHGLGWVRLLMDDVAGAKQAFDAAMEIDRNFADSHGAMAVVYVLNAELQMAEQAVERGLRLDRHSAASQFARSLILNAAGDHAKAQRMVKAIIRRSQADSNIESVLSGLLKGGRQQ